MGYNNVVVPTVDYEFNSSARTFGPLIPHDEDHFSSNLTMLLQWSPYSTEDELLKQFDDIGDHGTKVVIYNVWLNDDGEMELDFDSDPEDICINGDKTGRMKPIQYVANLYQHSLRAYASILYRQLPQYFRIILRGRDIEYHNIAEDLKYVQFIKYMPQVDGNLEVGIITAIRFLKEAPHAITHGFNIYHRNRLILCMLSCSSPFKSKQTLGPLHLLTTSSKHFCSSSSPSLPERLTPPQPSPEHGPILWLWNSTLSPLSDFSPSKSVTSRRCWAWRALGD